MYTVRSYNDSVTVMDSHATIENIKRYFFRQKLIPKSMFDVVLVLTGYTYYYYTGYIYAYLVTNYLALMAKISTDFICLEFLLFFLFRHDLCSPDQTTAQCLSTNLGDQKFIFFINSNGYFLKKLLVSITI